MWFLVTILALFGSGEDKVGRSSLDKRTLALAEMGYTHFEESANLQSHRVVVIDYSKPSTEKRLYVVDTRTDSVLLETYVAHGKRSGELNVSTFSNQVNSNQSSMGFFRISEEYVGKHGESYRLDGLEHGINHNARKRAIVIHSAWYVSEAIIRAQGRLGRSFGCPALSKEVYDQFQSLIDSNTLLFIYYPDENYLSTSQVFSSVASELHNPISK